MALNPTTLGPTTLGPTTLFPAARPSSVLGSGSCHSFTLARP